MKDRLKLLRNTLNLSQEEFGKRVGVTKTSISRLETGANKITDRMLVSISREFRVNIDWLKTGRGEMFLPISGGSLDELAEEYGLGGLEKEIIQEFLKLDSADRKELLTLLRRVFTPKTANSRA